VSIHIILRSHHLRLFRRIRTSLHLIASICDISHDRFCRCDDCTFCDRNAHSILFVRLNALFDTFSYRSCEQLFLRSFRSFSMHSSTFSRNSRVHRHLHFRLTFCVSSFESHHFVSLFCLSIDKQRDTHSMNVRHAIDQYAYVVRYSRVTYALR
jgi:hypothetical protein